jgi:UDP-3-O-[3-hydroxymyristoyl] N-acetylglucosamine deacetylase
VRLYREVGPVRFRRGRHELQPALDNVVATRRCTVLGSGSLRIATVEHLLAALYVSGWWRDLVIDVSGDELPILDGSAAPWLAPLAALGPPPPAPPPLAPRRPFGMTRGGTELTLTPGPTRLEVAIDFAHPAIGKQRWEGTPRDYPALLGARTFGFLDELATLRAQGLATAASPEHVIVYDQEGPLTELRYADEPVRHKALDALGDLYLLGRPLAGTLKVKRGSHSAHIDFMRELVSLGMLAGAYG